MLYIKKKFMELAVKAQLKLEAFAEDESGMEIIQVLLLLAVGLGAVVLFMNFSDQITGTAGTKIGEFIGKFSFGG